MVPFCRFCSTLFESHWSVPLQDALSCGAAPKFDRELHELLDAARDGIVIMELSAREDRGGESAAAHVVRVS